LTYGFSSRTQASFFRLESSRLSLLHAQQLRISFDDKEFLISIRNSILFTDVLCSSMKGKLDEIVVVVVAVCKAGKASKIFIYHLACLFSNFPNPSTSLCSYAAEKYVCVAWHGMEAAKYLNPYQVIHTESEAHEE